MLKYGGKTIICDGVSLCGPVQLMGDTVLGERTIVLPNSVVLGAKV